MGRIVVNQNRALLRRLTLVLVVAWSMLALPACDTATEPDVVAGRRVVLSVADTIGVRERHRVRVTVTDLTGTPIPDAEVDLQSSGPAIASLDAEGYLTGHAEGSVRLTARAGNAADTAEVVISLSLLFAKEVAGTGHPDLYTMTRHGTAFRNLTNYEYTDIDGAWSPDRARIAFWSSRNDGSVIMLMDADGSNVQELATGLAVAYDAAWSPDGTRIAFAGRRDGLTDDIYLIAVDGSGLTRLTQDSTHERSPAWSPDGSRIAFERNVEGNPDIHVMNADGTGIVRLTTSFTVEMSPVWSPDGRQIAFTGNITDGTGFGIHVMDADGSSITRITDQTTNIIQFDWSPEGDWFAFAGWVDGQWDLYLMPAGGGEMVRLTNDAEAGQDVRWR